ncbi:MAG: winged helix DNA-binding protein [Bacteroidota bacterium]
MNTEELPDLFPNPKEKMGYLLWQLTMLWTRKVNQNLQQLELTHTQLIVLVCTQWLNTMKHQVIQKDLVDAIKLDRMLISKLVSKMVDTGYMDKKRSEKDSRVTVLSLTPKGAGLLAKAFPVMRQTEQEFFGLMEDRQQYVIEELKHLLDLVDPEHIV